MRICRFIAALSLSSFVAGCAIHPVPVDVTHLSTHEIVRQIRCETRRAVIDLALLYLQHGDKIDQRSKEVAKQFDVDSDTIQQLRPDLFTGEVRKNLSLFWQAGIAYTFDLRATETNNLDGGIDLLLPIRRGSSTFGLQGKFDRMRQNSRVFTLTDTLGKLVNDTRPSYCDNRIRIENDVYPVAGKIGIEGMLREFVFISLFDNLAAERGETPTDFASAKKGPPTMVDSLEFQTTISATIAPKVLFLPAASALTLADVGATAFAERTDDHKVIVGIALPPPPEAKPSATTRAKPVVSELTTLVPHQFITAYGNSIELLAARANEQYLALHIFSLPLALQ